jgi:hypothetical protein
MSNVNVPTWGGMYLFFKSRLCKLQKGRIRLAAAIDKVYQLLAYGQWFSPDTPSFPPLKLVAMV